jgi:hypothetical protein
MFCMACVQGLEPQLSSLMLSALANLRLTAEERTGRDTFVLACSAGDADMEDMLGGAGPVKAPAAGSEQQEGEDGGVVLAGASSRRGKENVAPNKGAGAGAQQQQQQAAPAGPKPDMGESYKAWVTYQKNRWRQVSGWMWGLAGGRWTFLEIHNQVWDSHLSWLWKDYACVHRQHQSSCCSTPQLQLAAASPSICVAVNGHALQDSRAA